MLALFVKLHTHTAGHKNGSTHSSVSKTFNSNFFKKQDEESNEKLQNIFFYISFLLIWAEWKADCN